MSQRSTATAGSGSTAINHKQTTLISSLSLPAATTEEQACWQACWPADVHHRILFLELRCFYRLTALKYGPNSLIAPLVWLLLEVVHNQASKHRTVHQSNPKQCRCNFFESCKRSEQKLLHATTWKPLVGFLAIITQLTCHCSFQSIVVGRKRWHPTLPD